MTTDQKTTQIIMDECVKLISITIVCLNWSPITVLLHIVKVPNQQNTDENPCDLAASMALSNLVSHGD